MKSQDYPAQIIGVFEGDIANTNFYYKNGPGAAHEISSHVAIHAGEYFNHPEDREMMAEIIEGNLQKTTPDLQTELMDCLLGEERVALTLLINSFGGRAVLQQAHTGLAELVKSKKGKVSAYVSAKACSSAALLLDCVDELPQMLLRSYLLWHYSDSATLDKGKETEDILKHFRKRLTDTMLKKVWPVLEEQLNTRGEIIMRGIDFASLELAELHANHWSLQAHFQDETGIIMESLPMDSSMNRFFTDVAMVNV